MKEVKLSPLFVVFVFLLLFGIPLFMMTGTRVFSNEIVIWGGWGGFLIAFFVGLYIRHIAQKDPIARINYNSSALSVNLLSAFFSDPKISTKRKILTLILPVLLLAVFFLLVVLFAP